MIKHKKSILLSSLLVLVLLAASLVAFTSRDTKKAEESHDLMLNLISEEAEQVVIASESGTDFALLFSSDSVSADQELANTLETTVYTLYGIRMHRAIDTATEETAYEILIGDTNREASAEFSKAVLATLDAEEDFVWGYAYINGKLMFTANNAIAYQIGGKEFVEYLTDCDFTVPSDLCVFGYKTRTQYDLELKDAADKEQEELIETLLEMNASFTDGQFNTDKFTGSFYMPMIAEDGSGHFTSTKSGEPWLYPTDGQHPRYLINGSDIEEIKAMLEDGKSTSSPYYNVTKNFWALANATEEEHKFGIFPEVRGASGEIYRYDAGILSIIEAKAMAYLVTGDVKYAYEAIVCIKNAMLTLHYTTDLHPDVYHGPSHVMVILAAVYDWCYDVLTEQDKWQLIWGTAQILGPQMEAGYRYPPFGFNAVNGHGTGPQLLRDWLSVSVVFFDEVPDWYRYVAGRYFNEFLPVANAQFESGWVSQGLANYASIKVYVQMWAAYIIKTATGENFLNDDAEKTMEYFISHITPRYTGNNSQQFYFQTGDGPRDPGGTKASWAEYLIVSALYNNPVLFAQAKKLSGNFSTSNADTIFTQGPAFQLCFISAVDYNGEGERDGIETIQYFGYPAAQMTAREEWDNTESVTVLMRLMNLTMANHEGQDHGTFQIYYKGLLAATSGAYRGYGSPAHYYYQQATVSSNGLLIFNPANADAEAQYDGTTITNAARYYYSGSQRRADIATSDVNAWLSSASTMSETTGASWGYYNDGSSKYAYLGGDLTLAYDSATVDYVGRKMFTLFTGDADFPVLFFTFDQIASDDENFTKHWLLHTIKEPTIDQDNLTATVINGDGKMYVQSLYGADAIVKIGGSGYAWWINGYFADPDDRGSWDEKTQSFTDENDKGSWVEGKNVIDENGVEDYADSIWGRIELRTEGEKYSKFLTVMAVTDTDNDTEFEIDKFVSDDDLVYGAKFQNSIIAFINDAEKPADKRYKEFSFSTDGRGLCEYYIAGLEAGTWNVKIDGISVAHAFVEEEGELLTFTAPAGKVTVTPSADVVGANGGRINYVTGGAILPSDTLYVYNNETDFPLTTELTKGENIFVGWYTSPYYETETKVEFIPAGTTGTFTVYARWISNLVNEDYTKVAINHQESTKTYNDISYIGAGKAGSSFITKTDENGINYLEWLKGSQDPAIWMTGSDLSTIGSDDKCVSFTFKLSLNEGSSPMYPNLRLIAKKDINGASIGSTTTYLFSTYTTGNVISNAGSSLGTLTEDSVLTLRIVVDFKNGELRYYDDEFNIISAETFSPPASTLATNTEEFSKCLTDYVFYFYGGTANSITDAALRIYGIRVQEGDEFAGLAVPQTEGIKYNGNGVKIPADFSKDFNEDGSATPLPDFNDFATDGFLFDGWYTSETFEEGTKTTHVPAGYEGLYEVWAKWKRVFVDEDYSDVDIDHTESNKNHNELAYNGAGKFGSHYKTETASDGTKYLVFTPGSQDPLIIATDTANNVSTMYESTISYTFTFGKNGSATIPTFEFRLIGKHTVNGETGKGDSSIYLGIINANGEFVLGSSNIVLASIGDDPTTVRIVLDFENGTISAYDEWGNIIASVDMPAIPEYSGATTYSEWKSCFQSYILYMRRTGGNADKVNESLRIYGIRIEEGDAFKLASDEDPLDPNSIVYETNGGTLPVDAPTEYDTQEGTPLPTNVTKIGYVFAGWYTDKNLTNPIEYIPAGTSDSVKVYAKWLYAFASEDFESDTEWSASNNASYNGINFNLQKEGTSAKTMTDEEGNTYIAVTVTGDDGIMMVTNSSYNLTNMKETKLSVELDILPGTDITSTFSIMIASQGSAYGQLNIAGMSGGSGKIYLSGSSVEIGDVKTGKVSLRFIIDFAAGTISAYDEDGKLLDSITPEVPSGNQGAPETLAEWQKVAQNYLLYCYMVNPEKTTEGASSTIGFDNIKVTEGVAFYTVPVCKEHTDADIDDRCDDCGVKISEAETWSTPIELPLIPV